MQALPTAEQAAPLMIVENVLPAVHGVHCRLADAEPGKDMPEPTGHLLHEAHASLARVALNCPVAQGAHVKSVLSVAALSMYCPGAHGSRTALHAALLSALENEVPSKQRLHVRSVVAEPAVSSPDPAGHVAHALHAALPALALKCPPAQSVQTRSDDAPGATVSYWPAAQMVMALHTRSAVPLGATDVYWSAGHVSLCVRHVRSVVSVGLAVSYSFAVHVVTATHASPLAFGEYVEPATHVAHWRFAIALPATAMPEPVAQMFHAVHAVSPATAVNVPASHAAHVRSLLAVAAAVV